MKIGINGFGRIGRCILRAILEREEKRISSLQVNSSLEAQTLKHLLKYDSAHGVLPFEIEIVNQNKLSINGIQIDLSSQRDLEKHRWIDVDIVMECSGKLKTMESLSSHISAGAKSVILSTATEDKAVPMIVIGANQNILEKKDKIVSIGSCTTNCLAPIAKIINDSFGIEKGFITTIHAYTNDQNLIDANHKDLRRARCAAVSMIPTATGAASAIGRVIPELDKKLDGAAVRVPTPNVSMIDCSFLLGRDVSLKESEQTIKDHCGMDFFSKAITCCEEPLVSIDFNHNPFSCIVDIAETRVVEKNLLRIVGWYDNEWGFSNRMIDVALMMHSM